MNKKWDSCAIPTYRDVLLNNDGTDERYFDLLDALREPITNASVSDDDWTMEQWDLCDTL